MCVPPVKRQHLGPAPDLATQVHISNPTKFTNTWLPVGPREGMAVGAAVRGREANADSLEDSGTTQGRLQRGVGSEEQTSSVAGG